MFDLNFSANILVRKSSKWVVLIQLIYFSNKILFNSQNLRFCTLLLHKDPLYFELKT